MAGSQFDKKEEAKDEIKDFANAPLFSPKKGFEKIYEYKVITSLHTKKMVAKAREAKIQQRFVVNSPIDHDTKTITNSFSPTILQPKIKAIKNEKEAKERLEKEVATQYAKELSVYKRSELTLVDSEVPGTAHSNGQVTASNNDSEYKADKPEIGWSGYPLKSHYTPNSTKNWNIFEIHPVARFCYYFNQNNFNRPKYTADYHNRRGLPAAFFEQLVSATREHVEIDSKKAAVLDNDINKKLEKNWNADKKDPKKIAELFMHTITIASGLDHNDDVSLRAMHQSPNYEVIAETLAVAKEYGIKLNLDHRPKDIHTNGATALMLAAKNGDIKSVDLLLKAGASLLARDRHRLTVLHYAVFSGNIDIVKKLLLEQKLDIDTINAKNQYNTTPLESLLSKILNDNTKPEDFKMLEILMQAKATFPKLSDDTATRLLHKAAQYGSIELIKKLTSDEFKININTPDNTGATLLMHACKSGNMEAVQLLLQTGANLVSKDNNGANILHYAAISKNSSIMQALLAHEIKINIHEQDNVGKTPLFLAAEKGDAATVSLLLDAKADPSIKIPLRTSREVSQDDIPDIDYDKLGSDYDSDEQGIPKDYNEHKEALLSIPQYEEENPIFYGATLLHAAAFSGDAKTAMLSMSLPQKHSLLSDLSLLKKEKKENHPINELDGDESTSLHFAVKKGAIDIVKILLDNKAKPDEINRFGQTPLSIAVREGNYALVEILLQKKADPNNSAYPNYMKPLDLALFKVSHNTDPSKEENGKKILNLLESHKAKPTPPQPDSPLTPV